MNDMLTEKQINNLRKVTRHNWIPWFMLFVAALFLFAAGMKILFVHRICSLSGLTWDHVLFLAFSSPEPAQTYKGVEVLAAGGIETVILYIGAAVIFVAYHFAVKRQRGKHALLLELIDMERRTPPEPEEAHETSSLPSG